MSDRIKRLVEEMKAHLKTAQGLAAKAEDENRDFTDDERAAVTVAMGKAKESKAALDLAKADDATRKAIADLGEGIGLVDGDAERKARRPGDHGLIDPAAHAKSLGELFTDSGAYEGLLASAPNGQFGEKMRVQSQPVGYKTFGRRGTKALVTGGADDSAGAWVTPNQLGLQVGLDALTRPLALRDLVTGGQTTSDTIEYPKLLSITNNAAPVAEATTSAAPTSGGTAGPLVPAAGGGYKPESAFATTRATAVVRTIAHWIPATKRALSDAAQVRTLIDAFLLYGLEEELEDQMVSGDGTGENFTGILNTSGTQTQATVADPAGKPAGFGRLLGLRRAKTKVRLAGRAVPNGYVLNPLDVETLDEISDNDGRFYGTGPFGPGGTQTLWGLPVIECEGIPQGTAIVGDWRKAILWDREQASITVTDSHADFFVRNLVAILAEMRAAFGIVQPNAFVEVTL